MKFPKFMRKLNHLTSQACGILFLFIGLLMVFEVVSRYVFRSPIGWTTDYSCYIQLWALFCASSYTYMTKNHVNVDIGLMMLDKHTHSKRRMPRRVLQIINYMATLIFLGVLMYGIVKDTGKAVQFKTMTSATYPISTLWLYAGMIIGCGLMMLTVFFIILDLFTDSEEFL